MIVEDSEIIQKYWNEKIIQADFWRGLFISHPKAFEEYVKSKFPYRELLSIELDEWGGRGAQFILKFKSEGIIPFWFYDSDLFAVQLHFDNLDIFVMPIPYDIKKEKKWAIQVYVNWNYLGYIMEKDQIATFPNFNAATKAGIQKAFEIRGAQLNQSQNENPTHSD